MPTIVTKRYLNPIVTMMELDCPHIARKAKPGQFVMVRPDALGERIPLTIADYDPVRGTVTIMYQRLGVTTHKLDLLEAGDNILDVVGPLGNPTEVDGVQRAMVIGGGVGSAIAYPQAKALFAAGAQVDVIIGFRSKELVFMEDNFRRNCSNLYITTDDGTYGEQGFVNKKLEQLLQAGNQYDVVIAIGPVPMMRAVCQTTLPYQLKTIVSLNPIMVDGTGMCGCCRCKVDGQIKFACVDGPDFDGHKVDFDELMIRTAVYRTQEADATERHLCNLQRMADELKEKEGGAQ